MLKKIGLFCALIGLVAMVAVPAYAEVQNIRVSGDIKALAVYRNNYDLEDNYNIDEDDSNTAWVAEDTDSFLMSVVRLRVDADLTDNVAATVRLANLRDWDIESEDVRSTDIILDLANISLKEMLYSPLTLIIGRQELQYGNGLIVGPGLFMDPQNTIEYNDLSTLHGYDAIRAILDYDPWTLDLLYAKIQESDDDGSQERDDDTDLYGANLGYRFDQYDAEMEAYLFMKRDQNYNLALVNAVTGAASVDQVYDENDVYTIGVRGSMVPLENLTVSAEVAGQWGEIYDAPDANNYEEQTRDREAMAVNVATEYQLADIKFVPTLGVEYLYLGGEEAANEGDFEAWDPMYRGKIMGTIRDCMENLYTTNDLGDTSGWTNQHTIKASCGLDLGELVDGLSLDLAYLHYFYAEEPLPDVDDDLGDEISLKVTYDYTEDVQFTINGDWYIPGSYYDELHNVLVMEQGGMSRDNGTATRVNNDTAVSIIGACKVTF